MSGLVAVGLSHHTAPLELRERLAVPPAEVPELLRRMRGQGLLQEGLLLSTCNRVELYAVAPPGVEPESLASWLSESQGLVPRRTLPHLYQHRDDQAVRHLFRVAASMDSMVLGEPQIVGQVREAYRIAQESHLTGPVLHGVLDRALLVAKRVRTETKIAREGVSIGRAGVELARQVLGELEDRAALLIGAGEHGQVVARALMDYGLRELVVANRTFSRGAELAQAFGGSAIPLEDASRHLDRVDIVLTSTAAGRILLDGEELQQVARRRRFRSLVLIDLSVPRNIDPAADRIDGLFRFDIDDLRQVADQGKAAREQASTEALAIIEEEVERCVSWLQGAGLRRAIGAMNQRAEEIRQAELQRAHGLLERLSPQDREVVEAMTRAMVKKILHDPIQQARALAERGDHAALEQLTAGWGRGKEELDGPG